MSYLVSLESPSTPTFLTGAKASNLAHLLQAGMSVPAACALTFRAFENHLQSLGKLGATLIGEIDRLETAEAVRCAELLRDLIIEAPFGDTATVALQEALMQLGDGPLSVRSSSNLEDRADFSFAGQHDSFLNVTGLDQLERDIKKVWASAYSERAVSYLKMLGRPVSQIRMGVVLQHMVKADAAGVAFSVHPVTGDRDQAYLSAAFGLGESVVGGEITPDEIIVSRSEKSVLEYNPGELTHKVTADAEGGTQEKRLTPTSTHVLNDADVAMLVDALTSVEEIFKGNPQDMEWALAGGELFLLQARPMVVKGNADGSVKWQSPIPGASWRHNWRLGEWIPDAVTPLFSTWVLPGLVASREQFGTKTFGWEDMTSFSMPQPWFCIVNGYFFTRMNFPGQGRRKGRGKEGGKAKKAPQSIEDQVSSLANRGERISRWRQEALPAYVAHFEDHLAFDVAKASLPEIRDFVQMLLNEAGEFWSFIAPIGYGFEEMAFKPFYESTLGEVSKPHYSVLFSGYPSRMLDAQVALAELANKVKQDNVARDALLAAECSVDGIATLPDWSRAALASYDQEFGHQVVSLDIYFPTLGESPDYSLSALQALVSTDVADPAAKIQEVADKRDQAVVGVLEMLSEREDDQRMMQAMISYYQGNAMVRENANFYLQIGWPHIRKAILEMGTRLTAMQVIDEASQVFFLEREELDGLIALHGTDAAMPPLADEAAARHLVWQEQRALKPPMMLSDGSSPDSALTGVGASQGFDPDTGVLSAVGASPGVASGPVRIVLTQDQASEFRAGEVLVIRAASPMFTPLMLLASGLVVEIGGGASHSSLIARELGLPTVVKAEQATQVLENGQLVQVNGETGEVSILDD